MKYKNIDCTVENLREFRTSSEYKASFPKFFEFYVQKDRDEKVSITKPLKPIRKRPYGGLLAERQ